jgi:hypothetical protein
MMDARRSSKPRQIRGKVTAGEADLEAIQDCLYDFAKVNGFAVTFEQTKSRGDYGPLQDYLFGMVESPT